MSEPNSTPRDWTEHERSALLEHLDRRRIGVGRDKSLQTWAGRWHVPVYLLWCITLLLFVVADLAAFLLTIEWD